jgi:hypothetical protein
MRKQWEKVGIQPGYPNMFSQGIALALFIGYPQQTQPLILQDLRSADREAISRAIYVAGQMQESAFPDLFDDLKRISFSHGPCADEAPQNLAIRTVSGSGANTIVQSAQIQVLPTSK